MEFSSKFKQFIKTPQNTAIFSHRNPDGDAIGSSLAMRHYLEAFGHVVHVIFPSEYPKEFEMLPGSNDILIWDLQPEECKHVINNKNLLVFMDFNSLSRIDKLGDFIHGNRATRMLVDHHLYPDIAVDYAFSDTEASSTCEILFQIIKTMGDADYIHPSTVGKCIYTGIVSDTASFRYSVSPKILRIAAELVERGVDSSAIQDMIFNSLQEKHLRLLGHCFSNRMEFFPEFRTALIWLSRKDYEQFDIQRGDTEGIVNYLLGLKDVRIAAFIHNQPSIVKISLRSKGNIDVQEICQKYFNGGGHKNSSGGSSHDSLKATIEKFKSILLKYKDKLLS